MSTAPLRLRVEPLSGASIAPILPELARLRLEVFRDFPYLYDGDAAYEAWYLARFAAAAEALVVGAFLGEALVGAATAVPLVHEHAAFRAPFAAHGIRPEDVYYLAESVLLPEHRGQGIGHAFFDHREAAARRLGLAKAAFCAVVRPADHPLRPPGYRPLDPFWRQRGYAPLAGLTTAFPWRDVDQPAPTAKPMQFWLRDL